MSRYIVEVVKESGASVYLGRGRERCLDTASRYPHPSNARAAATAYAGKQGGHVVWHLIDGRTGKRIED